MQKNKVDKIINRSIIGLNRCDEFDIKKIKVLSRIELDTVAGGTCTCYYKKYVDTGICMGPVAPMWVSERLGIVDSLQQCSYICLTQGFQMVGCY